MVPLAGAAPTCAKRAAACPADARQVPRVAFGPGLSRDKCAAPFERNQRLIGARTAGMIGFSGTGMQDDLVGKGWPFGVLGSDFVCGQGAEEPIWI